MDEMLMAGSVPRLVGCLHFWDVTCLRVVSSECSPLKKMNIDIITEKIALDSSRIVAVNQGDLTIHLTGGIVLNVAEDTIRDVIKSIRPRQTDPQTESPQQ